MGIDLELLQAIGPMLFRGLKVTMEIAVIGILFGFVLGSLCGYALQSRNKIAKGIANIYVWIMRGTPIVVQALYVYFVVPEIIGLIKGERVVLDPTLAGILVITQIQVHLYHSLCGEHWTAWILDRRKRERRLA